MTSLTQNIPATMAAATVLETIKGAILAQLKISRDRSSAHRSVGRLNARMLQDIGLTAQDAAQIGTLPSEGAEELVRCQSRNW